MSASDQNRYVVKPVLSAFAILEALRDTATPLSVAELTSYTKMTRTTVFRHLKTLAFLGYVTKVGRWYAIGPSSFALGSEESWELHLTSICEPHLSQIAKKFDATTNLGVPKHKRVMYLSVIEPHGKTRFSTEPGDADHFHCTALGKAILAHVPERDATNHLNKTLCRRTVHTITKPLSLHLSLRNVRLRGFAVDKEENEEGCICYAVPVLTHGKKPIAAISVSLPLGIMTDQLDLLVPEVLRDHAKQISTALDQTYQVEVPLDDFRSQRGRAASDRPDY